MDFLELIDSITPEIHERLRRAVEIGRWPDGTRLSPEQTELTLQALIAYESRHLQENERVGYIDRGSKAEGAVCDDDKPADADDTVRWVH